MPTLEESKMDSINLDVLQKLSSLDEGDYIYTNHGSYKTLTNISSFELRLERICLSHGVDYTTLSDDDKCLIDEAIDILHKLVDELGLSEAHQKLMNIKTYDDVWELV